MEHSRRNQAAAADAQIEKIEFFGHVAGVVKEKKGNKIFCLLQDVMRHGFVLQTCLYLD